MSIVSELKKAAERAAWTDPALSAEIEQIAARAEAAEAEARRYRKALVKIRDARIRDGSAADACKAIAESELAKEAK